MVDEAVKVRQSVLDLVEDIIRNKDGRFNGVKLSELAEEKSIELWLAEHGHVATSPLEVDLLLVAEAERLWFTVVQLTDELEEKFIVEIKQAFRDRFSLITDLMAP